MISINFQPFTKSMTKVIEYMEKLEELEATPKQSGNKIGDKDQSEDKTGKSKSKTKKFPKKIPRTKGKRGRETTLALRIIVAISTVQSVRPREAPFGLTTLRSVGPLLGTRKIRGL